MGEAKSTAEDATNVAVEEPTPIEPTMRRGAPRLRSIGGLIRVERPLSGFRLLSQLFEAEQSGLVRK